MSVPNPPTVNELPLSSDSTLEFQWYAPASGPTVDSYTLNYVDASGNTGSIPGIAGTYRLVSGLVNGRTYTFNVQAVNGAGSSAVVYFIPFQPGTGAPDIPAAATATSSGTSNALIEWQQPASLPDSTIFWYVIKSQSSNPADPEIARTAGGTQRSLLIEGLNPSSSYTFAVEAVNCPGYGPAIVTNSDSSNTVPDAPTGVSAIAGNTEATVSFTAPTNDGGSAITSYTVTSDPDGFTATDSSSPITITGLTNETPYTFTVVATNSVGNSVPSSASSPVTPSPTVPGAPTDVSAIAGNTRATVFFTDPVNDGGSPILSYTATSDPGGITAIGYSTGIEITGLTNGIPYTFTVVATNSVGNSVPSSASSPVTPSPTVPGVPTGVSALAGNAQATVSFTAPTTDGGSTITSYTVTSSPDGFTATGSSSPITITGLTNETPYTFTVVATNSIGNSIGSSPSQSVIPTSSPRLLYSDESNTEVIGYAGTIPVGTLVIPEGVTSIASSAFQNRSDLITISLPSTLLNINSNAFLSCGLTSVTIPGSLTGFSNGSFSQCLSLTTVTIGEGVTNINAAAVFSSCSNLNSISLPSTLLSIESAVFANCALTSVIIPEGVTTIGFYTFASNETLTSVTFPITNTITINAGAFEGAALTSVTVKTGSTVDPNAFPPGCTVNYV